MAATNFTPIQLYFSTTASAVPVAANLAQGELAINITDGKLYYEDNAGAVQVIATKGTGTIGGSTTQIQYNNAGALAGNAAMVFNNSTNVTTLTTLNLTNVLGAIYGGTAQSTYTQGDVLYASAANTLSKLGIGTVNYILTSSGSVPQWSAPSSISVLTATNLDGGAAGSVPYQSGVATTTFLAIGAANRVMTSTGSAPQWVTALTGLTGVSSSSITNTSLTSGRVVVSTTAGLQADDADLTFDGTTLSAGGLSTVGLSTLVKTVKIGDSSFNGVAVFAAATPAKLYMGTGTVTDVTSAISATNAIGAIASLGITPIAATNTSVTYTDAATLYIAGAPSAGTNITITNPYSLYVAAGGSYFGGALTLATALSTGNGGTGLTSYTAGDLSYYATGTAFTKLAIGTAGQILTVNSGGTAPQWSTLSGVTVTTFSAGTTGFTPSTATSGAITLAGTLVVGNGGTGLTSLTAGSITYGAGTAAYTALAIGTAGQILTSSGTAPQWSTLSGVAVTTLSFGTTGLTPSTATSGVITVAGTLITSNGGTGLSSYTAGDLSYYASGTALTKLAIGTANRVLTSTGTAPQWVTSLTGLTGVSSTSFTENGYAVVSQADIGTADNEIPLNQYLGSMAYQNGTDYYNVGMTVGFRNRIINGAMVIDQRNAGASVTINTTQIYVTDRWVGNARPTGGGVYSAQQVSDAPTGFSNSLKFTVTTVDTSLGTLDYYFAWQKIEGFNTVDLAFGTSGAKTVTMSFWVKSSITGQFSAFLINQAETYSCAIPYTINTANTWEYKTLTFSGATAGTWIGATNGTGLIVGFGLANGTSLQGTPGVWTASGIYGSTGDVNWMATNGNTFQYTGVQLEVGTQATPFDWRPYTTELELCQRYYFVYDSKRSLATVFNTTDTQAAQIGFPVSMRTSPTGVGITAPNITTTGNWGIYGATNGWGAVAGYTPTFTTTVDGSAVSMSGVGGVTNSYSYLIEGGAKFSAEL